MQDIMMVRGQNNIFFPATESDAEKVQAFKIGKGVRVKVTQMSDHNYKFHCKCFALVDFCYEHFSDKADVGTEYKGVKVVSSKAVFRDELTILAGHFDAVYSLNGAFRLEARSWSYKGMTDEAKSQLFSDMINAALKHIFRGTLSEQALRHTVDQLLAFDR